jgi:hypothetical protein
MAPRPPRLEGEGEGAREREGGRGKVQRGERDRYQKEVLALEKKLSAALTAGGGDVDETAVWEVYAGTEKLIAVLKFRLDYETPGVFTELPDAGDPVELLKGALELLSRSSKEISGRRLVEAVETLRKARNGLRSYLTEKRKSATRAQRRARAVPS